MAHVNGRDAIAGNFGQDALYIFLYRHPRPDIRFHWALYHHASAQDGGWKFDIIQPDGFWRPAVPYNSVPRGDVIDDDPKEPLGSAVRIGKIKAEGDSCRSLHTLIRQEDNELNDLNTSLGGMLSCRVYVHRACERLVKNNMLAYTDWQKLEDEVLETGTRCEQKGELVIVDSKITGNPSEN